MTDIDVRIAKCLGWKHLSYGDNPGIYFGRLFGEKSPGYCELVPQWSSCLDLMWELEEGLTDEEFRDYRDALWTITLDQSRPYERHHISATAEQKAQAWLKVMERQP